MFGYPLVNVLGACLIITSMMVVLARAGRTAAWLYSLQSLVLVGVLASLGFVTGSGELFTWSATAFATKVVLVPAILLYALKKIGDDAQADLPPKLNPMKSVALVAVEVFVCFVAVSGIDLLTAAEVKPTLAVSLAHFFIGLTCIVTQRSIFKQIFGYCLMENGSHVSLALLAPEAPELVEIGVATDAIFAVIILAVLVVRMARYAHTLDADDLCELKG
ncbi:hydrogenase 4 membrane subunit [Enterorhabdus sp. P55]|uniref:hydrogenase 4 membrane subunit n=1 Tax=Enterorhabdus sp. P55 TaxID=2304571 RepID=UPI00136FB278|nr:hydrogenase 4 membrane subunit [Enterorhabdus sp. P55]NBI31464.1 hydrogenase 4 membrane subunit [Enterorhabdus sp. P55]